MLTGHSFGAWDASPTVEKHFLECCVFKASRVWCSLPPATLDDPVDRPSFCGSCTPPGGYLPFLLSLGTVPGTRLLLIHTSLKSTAWLCHTSFCNFLYAGDETQAPGVVHEALLQVGLGLQLQGEGKKEGREGGRS